MAKELFTPGPWKIRAAPRRAKCVAFDISGDRNGVCSLFDPAKSGDIVSQQTVANAYLIAAAPSLYEALKDIEQWFTAQILAGKLRPNVELDRVRSALSLASPDQHKESKPKT